MSAGKLYRETDADGRCMDLLLPTKEGVEDLAILTSGHYKIVFETKDYFDRTNRECFYPWVEVSTPDFTRYVIACLETEL